KHRNHKRQNTGIFLSSIRTITAQIGRVPPHIRLTAGPVSDPVVPEAANGKIHGGVELGPPLVITTVVAARGVAILKLPTRDAEPQALADASGVDLVVVAAARPTASIF